MPQGVAPNAGLNTEHQPGDIRAGLSLATTQETLNHDSLMSIRKPKKISIEAL